MSHGHLTDNTALSDILAQLLEPLPVRGWTDSDQERELTEESDLAMALRLLLEPDPNCRSPKPA
jgi:hypothetical protein